LWNKYRKDGVGLHSFIDPKDQEQYMYTQFEPENCHWLFPVFEQPDLKATLSMTCVVPHDWTVVSNDNTDPSKDSEHAAISASLE
jgi:aminopeptidase N